MIKKYWYWILLFVLFVVIGFSFMAIAINEAYRTGRLDGHNACEFFHKLEGSL